MNHNKTHIDNILQSLENQNIQGTAESKAKFLAKAAKFSFFRFYPGRFNIYYLAAIITITASSVLLIMQENKKDECKYEETQSDYILNYTHDNSDLYLDLPKININENPIKQNSKQENISKSKQSTPELQTQSTYLENEPQKTDEDFNNESQLKIETEDSENATQNEPLESLKESPDENQVILDTLKLVKKIQVVDTIKTQIKDTVIIKENNRRRRN
jgi:hypothetical protein